MGITKQKATARMEEVYLKQYWGIITNGITNQILANRYFTDRRGLTEKKQVNNIQRSCNSTIKNSGCFKAEEGKKEGRYIHLSKNRPVNNIINGSSGKSRPREGVKFNSVDRGNVISNSQNTFSVCTLI
ncbi:MAG: hypothetical protein KGO81_04055 [Bacteroidota bacterium]|nr:hypothetical protein [Bacteroidota bacterium]